MPIVLGGDHSIAEPDISAVRRAPRPGRSRPLRHPHRHRPRGLRRRASRTGRRCSGSSRPARRPDAVRADRPARLLARRAASSAWQAEQGITSFFMHDVRDQGIEAVVERTIDPVGDGPVFLSVDVDVLDPAFAPGTGTPEPGGMTSGDLLWACREVARAARARGRRGRRGDPDRGRLGRHHGARRRPDRPRDPERARTGPSLRRG